MNPGPDEKHGDVLTSVGSYYTERITKFGPTPAGVDWNSEDSQLLRFEQLLKIVGSWDAAFSLNDLGCGYGQLLDYLRRLSNDFSYYGYDLSPAMISQATALHAHHPKYQFSVSSQPEKISDYGVASGIFNVKLTTSDGQWKSYVLDMLAVLNATSRLGFAFNCLTSYSDADRMRSDLYYANPGDLFDFCKRNFARDVALLHDYGLYEFTILVRKIE